MRKKKLVTDRGLGVTVIVKIKIINNKKSKGGKPPCCC